MNKTELIERFTSQRLQLSEIRAALKNQIKKCMNLAGLPQGKRYIFDSNPIVMEVFEAHKSLNLAFMWLGKAKGFLGETHPYKESYNPGNKVIEKAVDVSDENGVQHYETPIHMLKALRADLKNLDRAISSNLGFAQGDSSELYEAVQNAFTHFHESCMWLGVALGNIKDMGVEETIAWDTDEEEKDTDPIPLGGPTEDMPPLTRNPDPEKKTLTGSEEPPTTLGTDTINPQLQPKSNESDTKGGIETGNPKGGSESGSNKNKASDKTSGRSGNTKTRSGK